MNDATTALLAAMAAHGLRPSSIQWDGRIHRFDDPEDRKSRRSAWYSAFADRHGAVFGSWRTGLKETWQLRNGGEPPGRSAEDQRATRELREAQERDEHARAALRCLNRWERVGAASLRHPYLKRKGITAVRPDEIRQDGTRLLLPMRLIGPGNPLVNIQVIDQDGNKRFSPGARVTATHTVVGTEYITPNTEIIYICEGWATGWSISHVMRTPVVVAFTAGNLEPVAVAMRAKHPNARIIVACDNDRWTTCKRDGVDVPHNTGVLEGKKAAQAARALFVVPDFRNLDGKPTDYNDLLQLEGEKAVRDWLDPKQAEEARTTFDAPTETAELEQHGARGAEERTATSVLAGGKSEAPSSLLDPKDPLTTARILISDLFNHAERATLVAWRGDLRVWTGTHYAELEPASARAMAYEYLGRARRLTTDKGSTVPFCPTASRVNDVLDALRAVVHLAGTVPAPSWLDGRVGALPGEILSCRNGLLHMRTRELKPHTPALFNTHALPYDYDPKALAPTEWLRLLAAIWPNDHEAIDALQEIFGYIVSGETRHQKLFMLVGPKRSGKGTIARVLRDLLGAANVAGPTLGGLATNFGLQALIGRPLAVISDARLSGRTDQAIVVERLLSISGEDIQTVDRKHREPWTGQLPTRVLVMTNELPRLTDTSGALASRFLVLTLSRSWYGREDLHLFDRLVPELPSILRWALDGLDRLRERGRFAPPRSSEDATQELEDLGSPVGAFLRELCVVQPGRSVGVDRIYEAWKTWCREQGRDHPGTKQGFGRDLRAAIPGLGDTRPRTDEGRVRMYEGVGLRDEQ